MKHSSTFLTFFLTLFCLAAVPGMLYAQQLAFPGAEGSGRFTSGGRGGVVYEVTNLHDAGPGSFRQGVEKSGARTIVFRVSGNIHLRSDLRIRNGNLTIAGQTAPGDGITIKGSGLVVDADNVIIRYLRFRPGDIEAREVDALWGRQRKNIIIDHCSLSWGTDEVASFYDNENFTMQWCIISESLYESVHGKGRHGYGGIWGGKGASFHHNLLAHHSSRNPRFNGARYTTTPETEMVDFRNNVIFNWGGNSAYGGEGGKHNMVANYYKAGPATSGDKRFRIVNPSSSNTLPWSGWYVADNYVAGYPEVTADNWSGGVQGISEATLAEIRVKEAFPFSEVATQTAGEAYVSILAGAGANYPLRDPVDARIVEEVSSGQTTFGGAYGAGKGIIDTQETVGGWPELFSAPAPLDQDHDGMADAWEEAHGLNPADPLDRNADADADGYTNLEAYLNSLIHTDPADFLRHPTALSAQAVSTNSILLGWKDNSDRESQLILERSTSDESNYETIASLPANTTSFTDGALAPGQIYFYRLQARNDDIASAYSEPLAVQTKFEPMAPDREKLVAFWAFNAPGGEVVADLSLHNNHGQLKEASQNPRGPGKRSNALDFKAAATASHVLVPHAAHYDFDVYSFSVSLWMKADAEASQAYLLHKGSFAQNAAAGTSGKWYGIDIKDGVIRFAVDDNITKSEVSASSADFLNGEWVHLLAVRDRARDVLSLYRNGSLVAETRDNTNAGLRQPEPLYLGNSSDKNTPYTGMLDEVKIFSYGLSEAEAAGLYAGIPMKPFKPFPADGASQLVPEALELSWSGDAAAYDLYMGPSPDQLALLDEDIAHPRYALSGLSPATAYYWRVVAKGEGAHRQQGELWSYTTGAPTGLEDGVLQQSYAVYPNPFRGRLSIAFELQKPQQLSLTLYDSHNRRVATLFEGQLPAGLQQFHLQEHEVRRLNLPDGVYVCVLKTSETSMAKRLIHLRQ